MRCKHALEFSLNLFPMRYSRGGATSGRGVVAVGVACVHVNMASYYFGDILENLKKNSLCCKAVVRISAKMVCEQSCVIKLKHKYCGKFAMCYCTKLSALSVVPVVSAGPSVSASSSVTGSSLSESAGLSVSASSLVTVNSVSESVPSVPLLADIQLKDVKLTKNKSVVVDRKALISL